MWARTCGFNLIVLIPVLLVFSGKSAAQSGAPSISQEEAEILVYLIPEAQTLRASGMDVSATLESSEAHHEPDSYVFWVTNSKRKNAGSVTVDYFFVNKYTAEVWSFGLEKYVKSPELAGVQDIIRRARGITLAMVRQYEALHPRTKE